MNGILRALFAFLNSLSSAASWPTDGYKHAFRDCGCGGYCPCHTHPAAAVSCPSDCAYKNEPRFDGCHRCDCLWNKQGIKTVENLGVAR